MISEFDTIAAVATSVSNAGIGIIRISGEKAMDIIARIFEPYSKKVDASHLETHRVYYGNIKDGDELVDECIVLIMKAPASYTREDVAEIDCHGGITVVYDILKLVLRCGARAAEPGEFTKRAFLNGRIDLSQAEAVMDLIDSRNEMARKNSLSQLKGGLSDKIKNLREEILYQVAFIESALDDPEHYDLTGYPEILQGLNDKWIDDTKKLLSSYDNGRLISEGIRTCIVGKPNAGKSSFLNALLGEERAIVTEIAGTTRDTLEESVTIDGITLNIVDTAGIRYTKDKVESIGVERAKREIENADLILLVMDTSVEISEEDLEILNQIKNRKKMILLNKSDKIKQGVGKCSVEKDFGGEERAFENENFNGRTDIFDRKALEPYISENTPVISISAKYGDGITDFTTELKRQMFHGEIDARQDVYLTNARHKDALSSALEALKCVRNSIESGMPEDFFTIDLMNAYEKMGLIIGESVEEDLVNEIFSRFCTGK